MRVPPLYRLQARRITLDAPSAHCLHLRYMRWDFLLSQVQQSFSISWGWLQSGMFRVITISMVILFFFGFFLLLFILALLWILIPMLYGLPSIPTKPERIRKALKMANLQPN